MLNLEGKTSAHTFTKVLGRLTAGDELGVVACLVSGRPFFFVTNYRPQDRSREFQRVARQWGFLAALKESIPSEFVSGLATGCPACPQPGINISLNWENETPQDRLYVLWSSSSYV